MRRSLRRRVRFLEYAFTVSALGLVFVAGTAFRQTRGGTSRFGEITVERINIVDANGTVRMIATNKDRFPRTAVVEGQQVQRQADPSAGFLFFNDEGVEDGGLTFTGRRQDGVVRADARLMFDQYRQDQTVGITYGEDGGLRTAGLGVWDRSDLPLSELSRQLASARALSSEAERNAALERVAAIGGGRRVFVGKQHDRSAVVALSDATGKPRLLLKVEPGGEATIEFLDAAGAVVQRVGPPAK